MGLQIIKIYQKFKFSSIDPTQQINLNQPKKFLPSPTPLHGYATQISSAISCNDKEWFENKT